jgi:hypothetical protein
MKSQRELRDMDAHEQQIKENAVAYNVVMFQPGSSSKVYQSFQEANAAIEYARTTLAEPNRIRSAMIYAIDAEKHHALIGTMGRDLKYKEVEPKYKK